MALMAYAIDGRGRVKVGFIGGGNQGRGVKVMTGHLYAEAGWRGVTGSGGIQRRHGQAWRCRKWR
jgi:hypothetical protein